MKRSVCILSPLILALSIALAAAQPALRVTVKSFDDLAKAMNRVVGAVKPSPPMDCGKMLTAQLGVTNLASFDAKGPWEVALWSEGMGGLPLLAVKGPITDISRFKASLSPQGLLSRQGQDWKQLDHGLAMIVFKPSDALSEAEASALTKWKAEAIQAPKGTLELSASLSEPLRAQAKAMLAMGRAKITEGVGSNPAFAATGANPKAMAAAFDAYFDLFDTVVEGLHTFTLGLEVTPDALLVAERLTAKPGSELALWMQPPADHVTAADVSGLDPAASMAFAGYMGKSDSLLKLMEKFMALAIQMQDAGTNDLASKDFAGLFAKMLPVKITGSLSFNKALTFCGTYTFPAGNAADAYATMKQFVNGPMKSMVGEGKMYSAATLTEKHHAVNGIPVDRFSLAVNWDHPMFKLPGQKAQLEAFWPGGKLEFDYALKDGKLLVASATGNQMQALLEGKSANKGSMELDKNTVFAGYLNVLDLVKQLFQANPNMPDMLKAKFAKLDPQQTSIEFQVSVDNQVHSTSRVPMKLLRELGRLKDSPQQKAGL